MVREVQLPPSVVNLVFLLAVWHSLSLHCVVTARLPFNFWQKLHGIMHFVNLIEIKIKYYLLYKSAFELVLNLFYVFCWNLAIFMIAPTLLVVSTLLKKIAQHNSTINNGFKFKVSLKLFIHLLCTSQFSTGLPVTIFKFS